MGNIIVIIISIMFCLIVLALYLNSVVREYKENYFNKKKKLIEMIIGIVFVILIITYIIIFGVKNIY